MLAGIHMFVGESFYRLQEVFLVPEAKLMIFHEHVGRWNLMRAHFSSATRAALVGKIE